jgi:hypothetical protein
MKKLSVILTLVVLFLHAGCQYGGVVSLMGTPSYHEEKVPAEYDLTKHTDQKVLVLVDQPAWLAAQADLRYHLTRAINKDLTARIGIQTDCVVPYDELSKFRSSQPDFSLLSPVEVGKALDANMVLLVMIEDYQLRGMAETGYYGGALSIQSVLFETATGEKLWPKFAQSRSIKVGFDVESRGQDVAIARLIAACAYCTTRYLYDCPKEKFKIIEDRNRVDWENWKE